MQITRQADYAIRAVMHLAALGQGGRAPTSQIAVEQKIPSSFLAKIVSRLSISGIVQTSRGARGGVSLARRPEKISLLEVIEVIDGPISLNECVPSPDCCPFSDSCPFHKIFCEAQSELVRKLKSTTFTSLANQSDTVNSSEKT